MIVFFTATGNSQYVAEHIAKLMNTSAVSITDLISKEKYDIFSDSDITGIVTPVYFYGLPTIVSEFISKLSGGSKKIFAIMTYGTYPGNASGLARKLFIKRGMKLTHTFNVKMPENYIPLFRAPSEEDAEKIISDADKRLADIVMKTTLFDNYYENNGMLSKIPSALIRPYYLYGRGTKRFFADSKCNGCGVCSVICPVGAIEMSDKKPEWISNKCVRCLACLHRCPRSSIQFGHFTRDRRRYLNPRVVMKVKR